MPPAPPNLPPAPPAPPASVCVCGATWTASDATSDAEDCRVPQHGCVPQAAACDGGDWSPWCVVASLPCSHADASSGVNSGLHGGDWIYCMPECCVDSCQHASD
eukprot:1018105-Prymnesium_polylepis.1